MTAPYQNHASPFHKGEQYIQTQLGVRDKMEQVGRKVIRDYLPEQHQEFYRQLSYLFIGHCDRYGWPWASIVCHSPGFIQSPNNRQLDIHTLPIPCDPLNNALHINTPVAVLGLDFESKRRNRLSAQISNCTEYKFSLAIRQTFGNCPKYIRPRKLLSSNFEHPIKASCKEITSLDSQAINLIQQSDTFFVSSALPPKQQFACEGVDISHRGGNPGFIKISHNRLTIPDYRGNSHFNTLGNFIENPKAGLLFIDFDQGHLLALTGTVDLIWNSPDIENFAGAERLWVFSLNHGYWLKNTLPLRFLPFKN